MSDCEHCRDDRYIAMMCCNGWECGCQGLPVDFLECPCCNAEGKLPPSSDLINSFPFFFEEE